VKRVRGQVRRVAALRGEAAEGLRYVRCTNRGRLERVRALGQLGDGRGGGRRRRATLGVEGHGVDDAIRDHDRDANEVAAHRAAGGAAERARGRGRTMRIVLCVEGK
jgi:hypothetical protein